jgi:Flp pilus assembly protein TadD
VSSEAPPPADPLVGQRVADGRYQVLSVLGRGGMGTVYRARQYPLDRIVVLKLIHRELASDPAIVARFEREMRVTAAIDHPHTVRVYDFGDIAGQPFLAMELVAGKTVRELLDGEGAFSTARLVPVAVGVAKALGAAHAAGIIHRDLKPDNVMLVDHYGERDFVKVLDFGIARPLDRDQGFQTTAGMLLGTPAYMSPEHGLGGVIDARSDLYALGVMLYEMACGQLPFAESSVTALLVAHASAPPPPLAPRVPSLPPALESLIMRLLAKSPDDRPPDAQAVVEALAPFHAGRPSALGRTPSSSAAAASSSKEMATGATVVASGGSAMFPSRQKTVAASTATPTAGAGAGAKRNPTGTEMFAEDGGAADEERGRPPVSGRRGLLVAAGAAVAAALVIVVVLVFSQRERDGMAGRGGGDTTSAPGSARGRRAAAARLLAADGEPPWPAACGGGAEPSADAVADAVAAGAPSDRLAALRKLPEDLPARWLVEARLLLPGDAAGAARAAAQAAILCPAAAVAHHLHGGALQKLGERQRAAAAYEQALAAAPTYAAPRFNLGLVRLQAGDAEGARAALDALAASQPDFPNLFLVRAEAHRRLGAPARALGDLEEQTRRHPDAADGWFQLGRARAARHLPGSDEALCRAKDLGHPEAKCQK